MPDTRASVETPSETLALTPMMTEMAILSPDEYLARTQKHVVKSDTSDKKLLLQICVVAIMLTVVAIGGCAAKKLIDKLPPPPPPPTPPTNAPPITNTPPYGIVVATAPLTPERVADTIQFVPVDHNNAGMQSWDISSHPYVAEHPEAYLDPATGKPYTHIITASIQGTPSLDPPQWKVVGSRIIWLSKDSEDRVVGTYFVAVYDHKGNAVGQMRQMLTGTMSGPPDARSAVRLLPSEVGTNRFFRLATNTNEISILTED